MLTILLRFGSLRFGLVLCFCGFAVGCGGGGGGSSLPTPPGPTVQIPTTNPPVQNPPTPPTTPPPGPGPGPGPGPSLNLTEGTVDPFYMPGGGSDRANSGRSILEFTFRGINAIIYSPAQGGREEFGIESGSYIGNTFFGDDRIDLILPPTDVRQAWREGWTGRGVPALVVDGFLAGDSHGYIVGISLLAVAPGTDVFTFDGPLGADSIRYGRDGALSILDLSTTPAPETSYAVVNASLGGNPICPIDDFSCPAQFRNADPGALAAVVAFVRQSAFYLDMIGRGSALGTSAIDAVLTKAAGNESVDAGYVQDNVAFTTGAGIGPRTLIVGATDGYYNNGAGAALASYSNFAGSNAAVRARFLVANGNTPFAGEARVSREPSIPDETAGTSFAAPRVAGYVAIVRHKFPNLTGANTATIILDAATYEGLVCNPNCAENIYGQGRVNVGRALAPIGNMR